MTRFNINKTNLLLNEIHIFIDGSTTTNGYDSKWNCFRIDGIFHVFLFVFRFYFLFSFIFWKFNRIFNAIALHCGIQETVASSIVFYRYHHDNRYCFKGTILQFEMNCWELSAFQLIWGAIELPRCQCGDERSSQKRNNLSVGNWNECRLAQMHPMSWTTNWMQ